MQTQVTKEIPYAQRIAKMFQACQERKIRKKKIQKKILGYDKRKKKNTLKTSKIKSKFQY
jgi:hypothetical protein